MFAQMLSALGCGPIPESWAICISGGCSGIPVYSRVRGCSLGPSGDLRQRPLGRLRAAHLRSDPVFDLLAFYTGCALL